VKLGQWMIGIGIMVGLVFPPFMLILGVSSEIALRPIVFAATIACGIALGAVNIVLARIVVGRRIQSMQNAMEAVVNEQPVHDVPCADNTDVFGDMARSIAVLSDHVRDKRELEAQTLGDLR